MRQNLKRKRCQYNGCQGEQKQAVRRSTESSWESPGIWL